VRSLRNILKLAIIFGLSAASAAILLRPAVAQTPAPAGSATLHEVTTEGLKYLTEPNVVALTGLQPGAQITRDDLQSGADHLLQTGLFSNVSYKFKTGPAGVSVVYHIEEAPRLPVYFDNFPWVADSELTDAIRTKLPFYDGHLPSDGTAVEQASQAIATLLVARGITAPVEHQPIANPNGEGDVLQFRAQGETRQIASLTFSDPALSESPAIHAHLAEIVGKEYSRATIDTFLTEQVHPFYLQQGFLRVKLGPAEIRLVGNPNQKLPERLPVYVPVVTGPAYSWKGAQWHGNVMLSEIALNRILNEKIGAVANGQEIEIGWDLIREQYGQKGYLDVKIDATPTYDDTARTISYSVSIEEGPAYHFGKLVLTGLSVEGEKRLQQSWPIGPNMLFDKTLYEAFLIQVETHPAKIFGDLPVHFDTVGHYLQTDPKQSTVDVLLDFKH
jgi:outer membrane protein assembly factor BamA